tara:strand:- start:6 stop:173 length:168 start_codon:yes stop_codon:yes gene_type:complete
MTNKPGMMGLANRFAFKIEFADQVGLGKDNKDYQAVCAVQQNLKNIFVDPLEKKL